MADTTDATTACNWIAIDVARYWNAVLIETAPGQRHRFKMANTVEDLDRLIEFIGGLGGRCRAGLEPTGDYHRAIAYRLLKAGIEVVSISSVAQSRYREAMFNSRDKNDPKDAAVILEMLKQGRVQVYVDPMIAGHHDLQELSKTYYQVSRARTKVQHAIINHHVTLLPGDAQVLGLHPFRMVGSVHDRVPYAGACAPTQLRGLRRSRLGTCWAQGQQAGKLEEIWQTAQRSAALPHRARELGCRDLPPDVAPVPAADGVAFAD